VDLQDVQRIDRKTWRRYIFYIDLAVIGIFAVSLTLLVRHTFVAGQLYFENVVYPERNLWGLHTEAMWVIVADTAFLVASLMWIFYRFFHNQYIVITRHW